MKPVTDKIIFFVAIIGLSIFLQGKYIAEFPSYMHGWAQSDRYALSIGFTENGMDFFHPTTGFLNPTPKESNVIREEGITAVDFPIHEYMVAVIMKITGNTSPVVFRSYTLFISIVGMYFLFLLIKKVTGNSVLAIISSLFLYISPSLIYYSAGFIPTIPSLSFAIIAYYFYFSYLKDRNQKHFLYAILFLTISILVRKPFVIFLVSIIMHEVFMAWKKRKANFKKIIVVCISLGTIIGYQLYNQYLNNKYGSIFLGEVMPPNNWSDIKSVLFSVWDLWIVDYFSLFQYLFIFTLIIIFSIQKIFMNPKLSFFQKNLLLQGSIAFAGALLYAFIMLRQFAVHDYYCLDSLFLPIVILTVFLLSAINWKNKTLFPSIMIFFVILFYTGIMQVTKSQQWRYDAGLWDQIEASVQDFKDADILLDDLEVPKNAKMLVLDINTSNIALLLMERKGFSVIHTTQENIIKSLNWTYDYIAIQDRNVISGIVRQYPDIVNQIERIGGNGKISIYKKEKSDHNKTILEFLQLENQDPVLSSALFGDSTANVIWRHIQKKTENGNDVGVISSNDEFAGSVSIEPFKYSKQNRSVLVSVDFLAIESLKELQIIISSNCGDINQFYETKPIMVSDKDFNSWENRQFLFSLPSFDCENTSLKLYFWNPLAESVLYDNFTVSIY